MARKKPTSKAEFVFFNVIYEDGSQTSNRKVAGDLVDTLDGDAPIREAIEAQDREISERSGKSRSPIKKIERVAKK